MQGSAGWRLLTFLLSRARWCQSVASFEADGPAALQSCPSLRRRLDSGSSPAAMMRNAIPVLRCRALDLLARSALCVCTADMLSYEAVQGVAGARGYYCESGSQRQQIDA